MAASGHELQIVQMTEDHRFIMDEGELAAVLTRDDIKDLPVMLVSVAGAFRKGKSFLLNFFLRYLKAPQSNRADGSWLFQGETLEGFSWRSGSTRNTTGILIWSQPFILNVTPEKKVAVLLMDTQGTFDNTSTINDCSNIFALSTLVSSVQIYNLTNNIQEDHLQHLHLFTEYGRLLRKQSDEKAFQNLIFLIRDWQNWHEYPYGTAGGNSFLETQLQIHPRMAEELQEVRKHIRSCFNSVSCFLMPHPGLKVTCNPYYKGELNDMDEDFKIQVRGLVESIFQQRSLVPKVINGKEIKARELFTYFKSYMNIFSSGQMPSTSSIMKVTTEAGLLTAIREMAALYETNMERECGENTPCVPPVDIKVLHDRYKKSALDNYTAKKKMGSKDIIKTYYEKLSTDIDQKAGKYASLNAVKQQGVIDAAKTAYNDKIKDYNHIEDVICVHPDDIEPIHRIASGVAMSTFDSLVRRISDKKDGERDKFVRALDNKLDLLKRNNERSNNRLVSDLRMMYWEQMQPSVLTDPPLFPSEIQREHETALERVLNRFSENRSCLAAFYPTDIYKDQLLRAINNSYEEVRTMNASSNGRAMNAAVGAYRERVNRYWNQRQEHLHPDDLRHIHEVARTIALATLVNNRRQDQIPNEDRDSLERMITTRYEEYKETNATMNRESIQSAFNIFLATLEELRRPRWYWIFIVPIAITAILEFLGEHFKEAKRQAINEFYKNRKSTGLEDTDVYYQELMEKINPHDPWRLWSRGITILREYLRDNYGINI